MRIVKSLGEIMQEKRIAKGLTQEQLAEIIDTSVNTIRNYEYDKRTPSVFTAIDIADVLGCTVYELVGDMR